MNSAINVDKDNVYAFLKKLTADLINKVGEMKSDFDKNPPQNT